MQYIKISANSMVVLEETVSDDLPKGTVGELLKTAKGYTFETLDGEIHVLKTSVKTKKL